MKNFLTSAGHLSSHLFFSLKGITRNYFKPRSTLLVAIFTLLYLLLPGTGMKAQDIDCNSVNLYYCPVLSASPSYGCKEPGCFRFHYDIFFQPNPTNDTLDFEPDYFSIIADLEVDGTFSEFNIEETEDCSPSSIIDSATIESHQVAIFFNGPSSFQIEGEPYYLATLVVDAYPGEGIVLKLSGEFGLGTEDCEFVQILCTGGDEEIIFDQPDECDSLTVEFGNAVDSSSYGGAITVPVYAVVDYQGTPGTNDYKDLDVLITVESDFPSYAPQIITGAVSASDVDVIGTNPGQSFTIYAKASDVELSDGINTLFRIRMPGPVMQSLVTTTALKLKNSRAQEDGEDCCSPMLGDSLDVQYDYDGTSPCDSFVVNVVQDESYSGHCQVKLDVSLDYTDGPSQFQLNELLLDFDLGFTGDVTIDTVMLADWDCPEGNLSPCDTCISWTPEGNVRYCINLDPDSTMLVNNGAVGLEIIVNTPNGCVDDVTFSEALVKLYLKTHPCVPEINVDSESFPACSPILAGYIFREDTSAFVKNDSIFIRELVGSQPCDYEFLAQCPAPFSECVCSSHNDFEVTPYKNDNVLCGVTTYDLVLINRHILGITLLDSPYKIIAADANKSGSITAFDLVEFRKLILHITETFSNNTSWRFVQADYDFPNPSNPFAASFPEMDTLTPPDTTYFIGIKIGDVNLSCVDENCDGMLPPFTGNHLEDRAAVQLTAAAAGRSAKKGEVVTLSVRSNAGGLVAFQAGLHFDPAVLQFIGPSKGDLEGYTAENFGLTELNKGNIRTLWFASDEETQVIRENDFLFNLTFAALADIPDLSNVLSLDDGVLENLAYDREGTEYSLSMSFSGENPQATNAGKYIEASCRPNPFSQELTFDVTVPGACPKATLWVFDAFGRRLAYKEVPLVKGRNELLLEESSKLTAGVLNWQVRTPSGKASGIVVKQ